MPVYDYRAMDVSGSEASGQIEAASEAEAQDQLRARGYFVTHLRKTRGGSLPDETSPQGFPSGAGSARPARPTRSPQGNVPWWLWRVGGGLCLMIGCLFLYMLGVRPLWGIMRASSWVETPCTVLTSELKEHRSTGKGSGLTYRVQIVYQYEYQGRTYQSDQYDFVMMSSNTNVRQRHKVVREHPPGKRTVCFVNPANPAEAVLHRGWTSELLWGLFPIPFIVLGLLGLILGRRRPGFAEMHEHAKRPSCP